MTTKSRCSALALAQTRHSLQECREGTPYGENTTDDLLTAVDASEESLHVPHLSTLAACGSKNWEDVAAHGSRTQERSASDHSCVAGGVRWAALFGLDLWADKLGPQSAGDGRSHPHAWSPF